MKAVFSKADFESELTSRFGAVIKPLGKMPAEMILTGIPEVDDLTGGLPRGCITEIYGPMSSGRTTLVLSTLAEATCKEEVCAVVDTNDCFDPASAAAAGANLDRVLWMRCASKLEHAFKAADLLLQGGGFGLVLLDLGEVPAQEARRIISSWWYRFRRVVENTPTTLVVIAQDSCVRSCAALTLKMTTGAGTWSSSSDARESLFGHRYNSPALPSITPFHSHLLTGAELQFERQKPMTTKRSIGSFIAHSPKLESFQICS